MNTTRAPHAGLLLAATALTFVVFIQPNSLAGNNEKKASAASTTASRANGAKNGRAFPAGIHWRTQVCQRHHAPLQQRTILHYDFHEQRRWRAQVDTDQAGRGFGDLNLHGQPYMRKRGGPLIGKDLVEWTSSSGYGNLLGRLELSNAVSGQVRFKKPN